MMQPAAAQALIARVDPDTAPRRLRIAWATAMAAVSILVYVPTLRNGFPPFGSDDAVILDTAAIHGVSGRNLWAKRTQRGGQEARAGHLPVRPMRHRAEGAC